MTTKPIPFKIHFGDEQLDDLHVRLDALRLPRSFSPNNWKYGTDELFLSKLIERWRGGYDWRYREDLMNRWPQFICHFDDLSLHFFHVPSRRPNAPAVILTHGWPDSFLRYVKLFPLLGDYNVVVPSLPGFAFSTLPQKGFLNNAEIAELWHRLMTDVLGYGQYVAAGGDVGRGVTQFLALRHPEAVMGIHLTDAGFAREIMAKPDSECSDEEMDYKRRAAEWISCEGAYIRIQSTKPQTLSYALADSPVALAAWMAEKYHAWSDWERLDMDDLLDNVTLYWLTNTACTSIRVYHANVFTLSEAGRVDCPVGFARFAYDVLPAPRSYVEQTFPVVQFDEILYGGHFTAMEQPESFARSLSHFVDSVVCGHYPDVTK